MITKYKRLINEFILTILILTQLLSCVNTATTISKSILKDDNFELIILHNNDMHARFEQTGVYGNDCLPQDVASNKCYGGFARTAHEVRLYRDQAEQPNGVPVLYLNAGDTYTGTPWFTIFKDNISASFLNILQPDAISLGNHEFDEGVSGLVPFLNEVKFPVLVTNLNLTNTPEMQHTNSLQRSQIFIKNGVRIGVIGYLTPETKYLAKPNTVEYIDEIVAINKEAEELKRQGVNILIALGHSGLARDKEIAENCPDIDLIIGGHSHTFLYSGEKPSTEPIEGPYPVIVKNKQNGKNILVVQAYCYTKYLGFLHVKFDSEGNLISHNGNPILLNGTVPEDSDVLKLLDVYRPNITEFEQTIIGSTSVFLDARECRHQECNIGNMIADSMVHTYSSNDYHGDFATDASIAFIQGGGIRTSIEVGNITKKDLIGVLPFGNKITLIEVNGTIIKNMLERSVERYDGQSPWGEFLQMAGVQVVYKLDNPSGYRVKSVKVLCAECSMPSYSALNPEKKYKVLLSKFIFEGGDGYNMFSPSDEVKELIYTEYDITEAYLLKMSPVYPAIQWRITMEGEPPIQTTTSSEATTASSVVTTTSDESNPTTTTKDPNSATSIRASILALVLGIFVFNRI
uniref:Apyrase n=1 Tax=Corethrella appendiculata TaxID=1370023 RepID=U5EKN3_9DIPT